MALAPLARRLGLYARPSLVTQSLCSWPRLRHGAGWALTRSLPSSLSRFAPSLLSPDDAAHPGSLAPQSRPRGPSTWISFPLPQTSLTEIKPPGRYLSGMSETRWRGRFIMLLGAIAAAAIALAVTGATVVNAHSKRPHAPIA